MAMSNSIKKEQFENLVEVMNSLENFDASVSSVSLNLDGSTSVVLRKKNDKWEAKINIQETGNYFDR